MSQAPAQYKPKTMPLDEFRRTYGEPWEARRPDYRLICDCCQFQYGGTESPVEPIIVTFACPACESGLHLKGWIGDRKPGAQCPAGMGGKEQQEEQDNAA